MNLDLLEQETVSGSGISWAISKSALWPKHITEPASHQFFTGRMPFLLPNQQCQSTEGKLNVTISVLITGDVNLTNLVYQVVIIKYFFGQILAIFYCQSYWLITNNPFYSLAWPCLHCCKSDRLSLWSNADLGVSEFQNSKTPEPINIIWCGWVCQPYHSSCQNS